MAAGLLTNEEYQLLPLADISYGTCIHIYVHPNIPSSLSLHTYIPVHKPIIILVPRQRKLSIPMQSRSLIKASPRELAGGGRLEVTGGKMGKNGVLPLASLLDCNQEYGKLRLSRSVTTAKGMEARWVWRLAWYKEGKLGGHSGNWATLCSVGSGLLHGGDLAAKPG